CQPFEKEYVHKEGHRVPVLVGAAVLDRIPLRWTSFVVDLTSRQRAEQERAKLLASTRAARAEADSARERLAFLMRAGALVAATRDRDELLGQVAELVVPVLADYCVVFLPSAGGMLLASALSHTGHAQAQLIADLRKQPISAQGPMLAQRAYSTGVTRLSLDVAAEISAWSEAEPDAVSIVRLMQPRSAIATPLLAGQGPLGVIVLSRGAGRPPFTAADVSMVEELGRRLGVGLANADTFTREHAIAETLQRSLLPDALPQIPGLDLAVRYLPATDGAAVGGDWYDAFPLADGRLVMTVGDVAGKGLQAAALMATVRQSIRVAALQGLTPSAILSAAEAALQLEYHDRLVTAFVGIVDPGSWTIAYASAGHPPALVRRPDGTLLTLEGSGLPLGAPSVGERRTRQLVGIPPGSLIVLYTDGLVEATRDVIEGERRLHAALAHDAVLHARSPATLIRDLVIPDGAGDDVAILTLALGRETHWAFESGDAVAAQSVRSSFVGALAREASEDSDLGAAELIFGELIGNVVRYAPGPIDIDLDWAGAVPTLHVLDRGGGFDLHSALPEDVMSERGRGLFIVSALGADLRADRLPGRGNHVRVVLPVRRREG
ncbi:MAG TPA: SpoIIE family protein phosphatase, partial [Candidatus Elarobacter sp.]